MPGRERGREGERTKERTLLAKKSVSHEGGEGECLCTLKGMKFRKNKKRGRRKKKVSTRR